MVVVQRQLGHAHLGITFMYLKRRCLGIGGRIVQAAPRLNPAPTGPSGSIRRVPTISRFFGIVIAMYYDDHEPPHFHARHPDGAAKIRIDTLEVIESTLGRRQLRLALAWAELHQEELLKNWRAARAGETLKAIEPLQ